MEQELALYAYNVGYLFLLAMSALLLALFWAFFFSFIERYILL